VSDSKKVPSLPPDDFSKTTPNIPRADDMESNDWEKTNYNTPKFAPQPPADDWGKTVANIPPIKDEPDFNKTYIPSGQNSKTPDWGVTDSNIKLPNDDFGGDKIGSQTNYGATSPFIQLPEAERVKYQNLPPTPTEAAEQKKEEDKEKKGGIPGWFWAVAGLLTMFFFAVLVLIVVYYFLNRPTGFEIVIQSAPPRSEVWVDNTRWSVTEGNGTLLATGLKANELKKIEIRHPNYTCEPREIEGKAGETVTITARCTATKQPTPTPTNDDCQNIKKGEFDKAERCANQALDNLKEPYSAEDVAKALNLYIINFAVNRFDIPDKNMKFLEKASNYLKKLPATTVIEVGGHTDSDGTEEKNQKLSENRAKSVRDALVTKFGVNPNMLTEKGYGESRPKPNNQNRNDDEKFQNRRIEYTVLKK
jgi:outer membrane protein OmpA-like peptidoglycan-associated protein